MVNTGFKIGDVVVLTPTKEVMEFINENPEYKKYVGERAVVMTDSGSSNPNYTVKIQYFKPLLPRTHVWCNKDLVLAPTEREFSGEV